MKSAIQSLEILGADDVCNLCGFSKVHLNRLIKDKKIPSKKISNTWIFSREDILEFQKQRLQKAKTDKRIQIKRVKITLSG